jgi:hypothetical protein
LAVAEQTGARQALTRGLGQLSWARWVLGARDEARSLADRTGDLLGLVRAPAGGAFLFGFHAYTAIARVHLASDQPERGEALLRPILQAAERSGWQEAVATTELVLGLCMEARGDRDQAGRRLARAAEIADKHAMPSPAWEAHAALVSTYRATGRLSEADEQRAAAVAIVQRVISGLKDEELRGCFRDRAKVWLGSEASTAPHSRATPDRSAAGP